MEEKKVYIVHGYDAGPSRHWFPWLKETLLSQGIEADVLAMPDPLMPKCSDWLNTFFSDIPCPDGHTYFVGHSLGCITILRGLTQTRLAEPVGGCLLVSGFDEPLPELPLLDSFVDTPLDTDRVRQNIRAIDVLSARDDPVVPFSQSQLLAEHVHAAFYAQKQGGHFLDTDGYRSLPVAYELLTAMMH